MAVHRIFACGCACGAVRPRLYDYVYEYRSCFVARGSSLDRGPAAGPAVSSNGYINCCGADHIAHVRCCVLCGECMLDG